MTEYELVKGNDPVKHRLSHTVLTANQWRSTVTSMAEAWPVKTLQPRVNTESLYSYKDTIEPEHSFFQHAWQLLKAFYENRTGTDFPCKEEDVESISCHDPMPYMHESEKFVVTLKDGTVHAFAFTYTMELFFNPEPNKA